MCGTGGPIARWWNSWPETLENKGNRRAKAQKAVQKWFPFLWTIDRTDSTCWAGEKWETTLDRDARERQAASQETPGEKYFKVCVGLSRFEWVRIGLDFSDGLAMVSNGVRWCPGEEYFYLL